MGWAEHVAFRGEMHTKFWLENLKGRDHLEELGMDRKLMFEYGY
jgi:hypothetical protein